MSDLSTAHHWTDALAELQRQGLRRELHEVESPQAAYVVRDGRRLCCLCSNNYLGLANHPRIIEAVKSAVEQWGWGAGASRLVSGHMTPHALLEARLAAFKGTEAALLCPTGYTANLAAIRGLAGEGDLLLLDRLNHGSIVDAAFGSGATVRVFPHRDYEKLEALLQRHGARARRRVIVTDSLFSMDGDFADLPRLVELKRRYDALLCIDEAHATGVFGACGRGLAEQMGVESDIDVVVGTLSKALGGIGGFVAASRAFIDWLINRAGSFIYTTALPPAACAAACAAIDLVEAEPDRRQRLLALAERLRTCLAERGFDIGPSTSQIIPLIVGEAQTAVRWSRALEAEGLLVPPIRPPTVPRGQARLRISLSSEHTWADLERLPVVLNAFQAGRI